MDTVTPQITVRLPRTLRVRIEREAKARGWSPSEVVRRAVDHFLAREEITDQSDLRHHRISEFTQIAVDSIIRRDYPDLIEPILHETNRRMETIHGKR